jgi:hypothetical protein
MWLKRRKLVTGRETRTTMAMTNENLACDEGSAARRNEHHATSTIFVKKLRKEIGERPSTKTRKKYTGPYM